MRRIGREPAVDAAEESRTDSRFGVARPEPPDLVLPEDVVAGEELVRSLPGEDDLQPRRAHRAGEVEERRGRRAQERLLRELDHAWEHVGDRPRGHARPPEADVEMPRDLVLLATLVEMRVAEADAERGQQIVARLRAASAATEDESRPPLRYAATGTSARSRIRTESSRSACSSSIDVRLRPLFVLLGGEVEIPPANGTAALRRAPTTR